MTLASCAGTNGQLRVLRYTQVYEAAAGTKLNVNKSTCLALGELRDLSALGVSIPCEGVKMLKVQFDPELNGWKT